MQPGLTGIKVDSVAVPPGRLRRDVDDRRRPRAAVALALVVADHRRPARRRAGRADRARDDPAVAGRGRHRPPARRGDDQCHRRCRARARDRRPRGRRGRRLLGAVEARAREQTAADRKAGERRDHPRGDGRDARAADGRDAHRRAARSCRSCSPAASSVRSRRRWRSPSSSRSSSRCSSRSPSRRPSACCSGRTRADCSAARDRLAVCVRAYCRRCWRGSSTGRARRLRGRGRRRDRRRRRSSGRRSSLRSPARRCPPSGTPTCSSIGTRRPGRRPPGDGPDRRQGHAELRAVPGRRGRRRPRRTRGARPTRSSMSTPASCG